MDKLIKLEAFSQYKAQLRKSILEIIYAILDAPNDIGFKVVYKHSHLIFAIVNMFASKDEGVKTRVAQILCLLCWWSQKSYEKVCNG